MSAYCRVYGVIHFRSPAGRLPVHWDQLRAQRSVTSVGKLYLFIFLGGRNLPTDLQPPPSQRLPNCVLHGSFFGGDNESYKCIAETLLQWTINAREILRRQAIEMVQTYAYNVPKYVGGWATGAYL